MKGYQLKILTAIQVLLILAVHDGSAQVLNTMSRTTTSDSLSLNSIIEDVINNHPDIKTAEEAIRNADTRIKLAKTGYYPEIDFGADYSNIGPVMQITIPSFGTFELFPQNNYTSAFNLRQMIYDFGKTSGNTSVEKENKIIGEQTLEQVRQKMAIAVINNFYALSYLQEALKIKDEELATLQSHLQFVKTMKSTGAATDYQILSTSVRISAAESEKVDIEASREIQKSVLASLTGRDYQNPVVRRELIRVFRELPKDSLINQALVNRNEMKLMNEESVLAGLRYDVIKLMRRPAVNFIASGGFKNGYLPDLNTIKANYVVGAGISVPIFNGMKTKYNLLQATSAIETVSLQTESTSRLIISDINQAEAYLRSASQKITQSSLQLDQAQKAYGLAVISFRSGAITNLELLDAGTAVSASRLMLLKARVDYTTAFYRLKAATGEKLY